MRISNKKLYNLSKLSCNLYYYSNLLTDEHKLQNKRTSIKELAICQMMPGDPKRISERNNTYS